MDFYTFFVWIIQSEESLSKLEIFLLCITNFKIKNNLKKKYLDGCHADKFDAVNVGGHGAGHWGHFQELFHVIHEHLGAFAELVFFNAVFGNLELKRFSLMLRVYREKSVNIFICIEYLILQTKHFILRLEYLNVFSEHIMYLGTLLCI